jgi:hypothetical protein
MIKIEFTESEKKALSYERLKPSSSPSSTPDGSIMVKKPNAQTQRNM